MKCYTSRYKYGRHMSSNTCITRHMSRYRKEYNSYMILLSKGCSLKGGYCLDKFKLGTLNKNDENAKYEYNGVWYLEKYPDFERIIVAPKEDHINLMLDIAKSFELPFAILYVLVVPRLDSNKPGRYQCPFPLSYEDVEKFCSRFKDFIETDGRHHLWICSANNKGVRQMLIYDNHNVIYVYDDISKIKDFLAKRNFRESEVRFPYPHTHMYNPENDVFEKEILEYWDWRYFPLSEGDN